MNKTTQYFLLAACALGLVTFTAKLTAADTGPAKPSYTTQGMSLTTIGDTSTDTNGIPDLLKTCPVSGDKLGEMGAPYVFVYKGQQVKLCCPSCKKDFDAEPAKYMKLIRAADKKQK